MGKKQVCFKMLYRQNKVFSDNVHVNFFLMENQGIEDPPSQLNGKFHLTFFFETVPNELPKKIGEHLCILTRAQTWIEAAFKL